MANIIVCEGNLYPSATTGGDSVIHALSCDVDWTIVPYVEPTDSTAIYAQLVALNEFDHLRIAGIIIFCLVMFTTGVGTGLVIRWLRRL